MNRSAILKQLGLPSNVDEARLRIRWLELESKIRQNLSAAADEACQQKYQQRLNFLAEMAMTLWGSLPGAVNSTHASVTGLMLSKRAT